MKHKQKPRTDLWTKEEGDKIKGYIEQARLDVFNWCLERAHKLLDLSLKEEYTPEDLIDEIKAELKHLEERKNGD